MAERVLGTLTIGQAPRADVLPTVERYLPPGVRHIHRGVLDGLTREAIADRYEADPDEAVLVTRLHDGDVVELSRRRMRDGVQASLARLEDEGCDVVLVLCNGTFTGLECRRAWLVEPDHVVPPIIAALAEHRQIGVVVPISGQIATEAEKWHCLARPPLLDWASPYSGDDAALLQTARTLQAKGAQAIALDCIGFSERHRAMLAPLGLPVFVSTALAAKAAAELLDG